MKRTIITLTIILLVSLNSLACIGLGSRPGETPSPAEQSLTIIENWSEQSEESTDSMNNSQPADPPSPEQESAKLASGDIQSSDTESSNNEVNEYAVSATNFGCTCSIDTSTMSISLDIDGDQLTYAGNVYNKIADNTYKRTYMGYYINVSGEGDNKTTTQVDEERHDIIILTEDGFISEHYQGDEPSPCCFHTFTLNK
jgi:hypothetical protein